MSAMGNGESMNMALPVPCCAGALVLVLSARLGARSLPKRKGDGGKGGRDGASYKLDDDTRVRRRRPRANRVDMPGSMAWICCMGHEG